MPELITAPALAAKTPRARRWRQAGLVLLLVAALMLVTANVELAMGRTPISTSGSIRLWVGDLNSSELSQQILDWYSFSHVLHGILLYGVFHLILRRRKIGTRLLLTVALECAWEILENSPIIINRYRAATIAQGYVGDSVLNSMSDIGCCILGFWLARKLPWWVSVLVVVVVEVGLAWAIRDNLTLNVIMLIHPFAAIKHWQMGL